MLNYLSILVGTKADTIVKEENNLFYWMCKKNSAKDAITYFDLGLQKDTGILRFALLAGSLLL